MNLNEVLRTTALTVEELVIFLQTMEPSMQVYGNELQGRFGNPILQAPQVVYTNGRLIFPNDVCSEELAKNPLSRTPNLWKVVIIR